MPKVRRFYGKEIKVRRNPIFLLFLRRENLCGVFKEKLEQFVACAVNFKAVCACRC